MPKSFTYLLVDLLTIIVCLLASFDRRVRFNKHFGTFLISASVVAIPFVVWDIWFTHKGIWWFNSDYTTGAYLAGLPIEEILFFFCIPFSCVFTYFVIDKYYKLTWTNSLNNLISFCFIILFALLALSFTHKLYTFVTTISATIMLLFLHIVMQVQWIGKATLVYFMLIPGFFIVNGVLTGTGPDAPIVNYNPEEFMGIRLLTIPIEDAIYGYTLFMLNIYTFKKMVHFRERQ